MKLSLRPSGPATTICSSNQGCRCRVCCPTPVHTPRPPPADLLCPLRPTSVPSCWLLSSCHSTPQLTEISLTLSLAVKDPVNPTANSHVFADTRNGVHHILHSMLSGIWQMLLPKSRLNVQKLHNSLQMLDSLFLTVFYSLVRFGDLSSMGYFTAQGHMINKTNS